MVKTSANILQKQYSMNEGVLLLKKYIKNQLLKIGSFPKSPKVTATIET